MRSIPPAPSPVVRRPADRPGPLVRPRAFRIALNAMIGLLGLEFLLGMAITLYVTILPPDLARALAGGAGGSALLVAAHVAVGTALGAGGLATLVLTLAERRPALLGGAAIGLAGVLLAAAGGAAFLSAPGQPAYSYAMAVGFLVAFWSYFWVRNRTNGLHGVPPAMGEGSGEEPSSPRV
jgi:hypothetical protein